MTETKDNQTIETIVFDNRPPLRMIEDKIISITAESHDFSGSRIMLYPTDNHHQHHIWLDTWSNVDGVPGHIHYGDVASGYDRVLSVLRDLLGDGDDVIGGVLVELQDRGIVELEIA